LPPAKNYFEAALEVIPRVSRIKPSSTACGKRIIIPSNATNDGYETDLVLFVSVIEDPSDSYTAHSWICTMDGRTNRPIAGVIEFNMKYLQLDTTDPTFEMELATTMHEIIHVLGFDSSIYDRYINPSTLEPLTGHVLKKTVNGVETMILDVYPLTDFLQYHFNCSTLEGAYMENQGGSGSYGSHFERRIFYNEMMTPSRIKDRRLSLFTLALLQGTGWYQPDYSSYAEPMTYGKDAGCAFFNTECINRETLEPNFKEFCSPLTSFGVSYTKRGLGYCGSYRYQTSDDLISAFDYWGNKTVVWDSFADNCPQIDVSFDCENITRGTIALLEDYESYGIGGKGFLGTLSLDGTPYSRFVDYCFKTQCKLNKGHYELQVLFGRGKEGDNVTCTTAGQVDASDFPFEHNLVGH